MNQTVVLLSTMYRAYPITVYYQFTNIYFLNKICNVSNKILVVASYLTNKQRSLGILSRKLRQRWFGLSKSSTNTVSKAGRWKAKTWMHHERVL